MRHRQIVVLQIDVDDDPMMEQHGDPAGWPWGDILESRYPHILDSRATTVTEEMLDAGSEALDEMGDYRRGYWKYQYHEAQHVPYYVNTYAVGQGYGGPEEGGWWFSTGDPIEEACEVYETPEAAEIARAALQEQWPSTDRQYSVNGGEDYAVRIEDHPPRSWPESRPHYC